MNKKINRPILVLIFILSGVYSSVTHSAPNWYSGVVNRVALAGSDGSFLVTFNSSALSDCEWGYVYFNVSQLGLERVRNAYAIALISLSAGRSMRVVIDKDINGAGGVCNATGMTADLR